MLATSNLTGEKVNRFTHIHQGRRPGQEGQDAASAGPEDRRLLPALRGHGRASTRSDSRHLRDRPGARAREYHARFRDYLRYLQENDLVADGAMTDVKGDRSLVPAQQADPDLFLHVVGTPRRRHRRARARRPTRRAPATRTRSSSCRPSRMREGRRGLRRLLRRAGGRPRHHLHLRPPVLRHAQARGRRARRGQQAVRRPGGADRLRRRLRALGARLHGRRDRVHRQRWSSASPATTARATAAARSAWATC